MTAFSAEELDRSDAYHRRLSRLSLLTAGADVLSLLAAARWWAAHGPYTPGRAAALLGAIVALAPAPGRLLGGLWRELRLEAACGSAAAIPLPGSAAAVVAVVTLDQCSRALARALAAAVASVAVAVAVAMPRWVALVLGPLIVGVAWPALRWAEQRWRHRVDRVTALAEPGPVLDDLVARAGATLAMPVRWLVADARWGPGVEGGWTEATSRAVSIVIDRRVFDGGRALLEAVAAHELGHAVAAPDGGRRRSRSRPRSRARSGLRLAMRSIAAGASAAFVVTAVLVVLVGRRPLGPLDVLVAAAVLVGVGLLGATWRRREEAAADRYGATLLSDRAASAAAVRRLLVEQGVDLRPQGVRRWLAVYPPATTRLELLAGTDGTDC